MADWTDYAALVASLAAGKAFTDEKAQALAENPVAILEAATDAPVLQQTWHPYDMVEYGDGNDGVIYDFAVDGRVASVTSPDLVDGFEYRLVIYNLFGQANGLFPVEVSLYRETSATWVLWFEISGAINKAPNFKDIELLFPRVSQRYHATGAADFTTSQKVLRLRVVATDAGNQIDNGVIKLFKRRCIV